MYILRMRAAHLVIPCFAVLLLAGPVLAGAENLVADQVRFTLTYDWVEIDSTTDNRNEQIGTVSFQVRFDQARAGYLQGATIRLLYNPAYLDLVDARPVPGWGSVVPPDPIEEAIGELMQVTYLIDPAPGASTIPILTTPTDLAEFDFVAKCQPGAQTNAVQIVYSSVMTTVDDGTDVHHVTTLSRITHGWIRTRSDLVWQFNIAAVDSNRIVCPGALGTEIPVPIYALTNFRLGDIEMYISFDNTKLTFLGLANWEGYFSDAQYGLVEPGLLQVILNTDEAVHARHEFAGGTKMLDMLFYVLGNWQGSSANVIFSTVPDVMIAQGSGYCTEMEFGGVYPFSGQVHIPAYHATFSTEFTDGGTLSLVDDEVSMMINLTNNFPAGGAWHSIIANLCLGLNLEKSGLLTYEAINFGPTTYDGELGQELSLWAEYNPGFLGMTETPQDMVSFNIRTVSGFTPPTSYDNRFYPIVYQTVWDSDPNYNARVTDTTGRVTLNNSAGTLTWDNPQVEYLMGEYYCNPVQVGSGYITQDYFTRSAFALHDFRVKITVTGDHHMWDIAPQPGVMVESFDNVNFKWAILKAGPEWADQAPTSTRTKFASITYAYWGGSNLVMALAGPPPQGHWVTKVSTVAFQFDAASGYYMKDPDLVDQHEVAIGNSIVNRWWVNNDDPPYDNMTRLGEFGTPVAYELEQNYPNPFNPSTEFWYGLPEGAFVELCVYNITGQKVATLVSGWQDAGYYHQVWDGTDLASGVYFYRLQANSYVQTRKMILLK
ncbi:MAG: T9SS type A sorting domain-containing protein [Candidatus Zixiibacteriota bacterium]